MYQITNDNDAQNYKVILYIMMFMNHNVFSNCNCNCSKKIVANGLSNFPFLIRRL